jgi:hypothetical protein
MNNWCQEDESEYHSLLCFGTFPANLQILEWSRGDSNP